MYLLLTPSLFYFADPSSAVACGAQRLSRLTAAALSLASRFGARYPLEEMLYTCSIWPLHDIAMTTIVWCMAHTKSGSGGVVYCAIVVQ